MEKNRKYILALRKCAIEHDNDETPFTHIIVSDLCRETAKLLEELEQEPKWIPVDERLPEEGTFVLASYNSDEGADVIMTYYNKYGFTRGLMTAWMPLPEPYKEDKE